MTYSTELETMPHMQDVLDLLNVLNYGVQNPSEIIPDEKYLKFIQNEFFYNICKNLIIQRIFQNDSVLSLSNQILQETLIYIMKQIDQDKSKLAELFAYLTDIGKLYYKQNNLVQYQFRMQDLMDTSL